MSAVTAPSSNLADGTGQADLDLGERPEVVSSVSALDLCDQIVGLHRSLSAQASLTPTPAVNELFDQLVRTCTRTDDGLAAPVLADPRVSRLRPDLLRLCSAGEAELERAWARRIAEATDPWAELAAFPYLDNYRKLTRLELHSLAGSTEPPTRSHRVCFLGGGPLPLTPLLIQRELGVPVDVVDNDPEAVRLARDVVDRLAPDAGIRVLLADATRAADMARVVAGSDVVVIAALVGLTPDRKAAVLRAVGGALDPGARLVVRSAHGLRSLLYPVVDPRDVTEQAGCAPELLVHPLGDVVNSVLVARRRRAAPDGREGSPAAPW